MMIVIGVDPASGKKGSALYSPELDLDRLGLGVEALRSLLAEIREHHQNVLLCWDAPLTGPPRPDADDPGDLIQREVESNYWRVTKDVPGVSVRGFADLSHWVVTRNILGLPRVGRFDAKLGDLPFKPALSNPAPRGGHRVAEVHPTLAVWAWLKERFQAYKGAKLSAERRRRAIEANWSSLSRLGVLAPGSQLPSIKTGLDDAFDARVAWVLGRQWVVGGAELVGSSDGAFLMPKQ